MLPRRVATTSIAELVLYSSSRRSATTTTTTRVLLHSKSLTSLSSSSVNLIRSKQRWSTSTSVLSVRNLSTSGDDQKKKEEEEGAKSKKEGEREEKPTVEGEANTNKSGGLSDRVTSAMSSVRDFFASAVAKDETSWTDAARAVFGLKPVDKPKPAVEEEEKPKTTPTTEAQEAAKSPEQEAHEFLHKTPTIDPFAVRLAALQSSIGPLEIEREKAQDEGNMGRFKELNREIVSIKREIGKISAKMNSTEMVIVEERKGAWEQFGSRLRDTPLIKGIFGLGDTQAAKKLSDAAEDAREAWETSQNPLVYRAHSLWSSMFAENEIGETVRELRKRNPDFTLESFMKSMEEETIPTVLGAFLRGDVKTLQTRCGEGSLNALKGAIDERKKAGRVMDTNILAIQNSTIAAAKVVDKMGPLVVVQFMAQQIDALYDLEGKVVEGDDNRVAAVFYAFAMTYEAPEAKPDAAPEWVVKEFAIVGSVPWV